MLAQRADEVAFAITAIGERRCVVKSRDSLPELLRRSVCSSSIS